MVHVEDTAVASRAVMAPFWLEHVAHEAVPSALVLWVTQVEALGKVKKKVGTQKTGTCPGSVVIAWKKDQTSMMKKRWKKARRINTGIFSKEMRKSRLHMLLGPHTINTKV